MADRKKLPRFLKDEEVEIFFRSLKELRDRAIFMLMLRCGLRVEEVAHLRLKDLALTQRRSRACRVGPIQQIEIDGERAYEGALGGLKPAFLTLKTSI